GRIGIAHRAALRLRRLRHQKAQNQQHRNHQTPEHPCPPIGESRLRLRNAHRKALGSVAARHGNSAIMTAMMRQTRKQILTMALFALVAAAIPPASAQPMVRPVVTAPLTGVALDGYDAVSYF